MRIEQSGHKHLIEKLLLLIRYCGHGCCCAQEARLESAHLELGQLWILLQLCSGYCLGLGSLGSSTNKSAHIGTRLSRGSRHTLARSESSRSLFGGIDATYKLTVGSNRSLSRPWLAATQGFISSFLGPSFDISPSPPFALLVLFGLGLHVCDKLGGGLRILL